MKCMYLVCLLALWSCCLLTTTETNQPFSLHSQQWQTLLQLIKKNPALLERIRSNPVLLSGLQASLQKQIEAQGLLKSQHQSSAQKFPPQPQPQSVSSSESECESLRKQNIRLKQMIKVVVEDNFGIEASSNYLSKDDGRNSELFLTNQPDITTVTSLVQSFLVTPSPIWSEVVETSSYLTKVTTPVSTEVPIIVRGNKIITTIVEDTILEVTATEIITSSVQITPTPTWSFTTSTHTITIPAPKQTRASFLSNKETNRDRAILKNPRRLPKQQVPSRQFDEETIIDNAEAFNINRDINQKQPKSRLDRLKQAYGVFFASSAQRSAKRFGNIIGNKNPIFGNVNDDTDDEDSYDYLDDFDQQGLAAQENPVSIKKPKVPQPTTTKETPVLSTSTVAKLDSSLSTLYFSGKEPGKWSSSVITITGKSINKREAISPSNVEPILKTKQPHEIENKKQILIESGILNEINWLLNNSIESSIRTVTQTVTVTKTQNLCGY